MPPARRTRRRASGATYRRSRRRSGATVGSASATSEPTARRSAAWSTRSAWSTRQGRGTSLRPRRANRGSIGSTACAQRSRSRSRRPVRQASTWRRSGRRGRRPTRPDSQPSRHGFGSARSGSGTATPSAPSRRGRRRWRGSTATVGSGRPSSSTISGSPAPRSWRWHPTSRSSNRPRCARSWRGSPGCSSPVIGEPGRGEHTRRGNREGLHSQPLGPQPPVPDLELGAESGRTCSLRLGGIWSLLPPQPGDDPLGVGVGREDRVEGVLDRPLAEDRGQPLEQGYPRRFERR